MLAETLIPLLAESRKLLPRIEQAITRACADGSTLYRGRRLHLSSGRRAPFQSRPGPPSSATSWHRAARRLRVVSWNCGGLSSSACSEVLVWLREEAKCGRPVDVMCLQETSWKEDCEFVTGGGQGPGTRWHVVHTGCKEKAGGDVPCECQRKAFGAPRWWLGASSMSGSCCRSKG